MTDNNPVKVSIHRDQQGNQVVNGVVKPKNNTYTPQPLKGDARYSSYDAAVKRHNELGEMLNKQSNKIDAEGNRPWAIEGDQRRRLLLQFDELVRTVPYELNAANQRIAEQQAAAADEEAQDAAMNALIEKRALEMHIDEKAAERKLVMQRKGIFK